MKPASNRPNIASLLAFPPPAVAPCDLDSLVSVVGVRDGSAADVLCDRKGWLGIEDVSGGSNKGFAGQSIRPT